MTHLTPIGTGDQKERFRQVLGQYPTGVAVITARQQDGTPAAMVVGSFTSVSLDPPLVGFLPDRKSTSWPLIRAAGRFCANVLSADQEHVCRAFFSKQPDRFDLFCPDDAGSGSPRIENCTAWVDCDIESIMAAGDHDIVLGRVRDMAVGHASGPPLLFLRGGYGAPVIRSLQVEGPGLALPLHYADLARPETQTLMERLHLDTSITCVADGSVVLLLEASAHDAPVRRTTRVGAHTIFGAPHAPMFIAWSDQSEINAWIARGAELGHASDRAEVEAELADIRRRLYWVRKGHSPWTEVHLENPRLDGVDPLPPDLGPREVIAIHAPVFGPDGEVAVSLGIRRFPRGTVEEGIEEEIRAMVEAAARVTSLIEGHRPEDVRNDTSPITTRTSS